MARLRQLVVDSREPSSLARFWSAALDDSRFATTTTKRSPDSQHSGAHLKPTHVSSSMGRHSRSTSRRLQSLQRRSVAARIADRGGTRSLRKNGTSTRSRRAISSCSPSRPSVSSRAQGAGSSAGRQLFQGRRDVRRPSAVRRHDLRTHLPLPRQPFRFAQGTFEVVWANQPGGYCCARLHIDRTMLTSERHPPSINTLQI
jgi:hypothetical protein